MAQNNAGPAGCMIVFVGYLIGISVVAKLWGLLVICLILCSIFLIKYIQGLLYLSKQKEKVIANLTAIAADLKRVRVITVRATAVMHKCQKCGINIQPKDESCHCAVERLHRKRRYRR